MGEEKEEVMFIDITFFGRTAEIANQYLKKGSKILVEGRFKLDQWTDKSGQKRSKHSLVVESMKMLGGRGEETFTGPVPAQEIEKESVEKSSLDIEVEFDNEDIAF